MKEWARLGLRFEKLGCSALPTPHQPPVTLHLGSEHISGGRLLQNIQGSEDYYVPNRLSWIVREVAN